MHWAVGLAVLGDGPSKVGSKIEKSMGKILTFQKIFITFVISWPKTEVIWLR